MCSNAFGLVSQVNVQFVCSVRGKYVHVKYGMSNPPWIAVVRARCAPYAAFLHHVCEITWLTLSSIRKQEVENALFSMYESEKYGRFKRTGSFTTTCSRPPDQACGYCLQP